MGIGNGQWEIRNWKWDMGNGRLKPGNENGKWALGHSNWSWDLGIGTLDIGHGSRGNWGSGNGKWE